MTEPTNEQILVFLLLPFLKKAETDAYGEELEDKLERFSLDDLIGKKREKVTRIKNPLPYNKEGESPNPRELIIEEYSDGSYLLHMQVGHHDFTIHHTFLVENRLRYSCRLFWDSP